MEFVVQILAVIAATVAFSLAYWLYQVLRFKYFSKKHADYARNFSPEEESFLLKSSASIQQLYTSSPKFPRWYSFFLYLAFVPTMMFCCLIGFCFWVGFVWLAKQDLKGEFPNALATFGPDIGLGAIFVLFACILIAAWLLYFVSAFSRKMSLFVAMKSDAYGFNETSIMQGHIVRLEHEIRLKKIPMEKTFEADDFVARKIFYYRRIFGWLGLILLLPGLVFAVFDLRQFTIITIDGVFVRESYWRKNIKQLDFNDIDIVKFRCDVNDNGKMHANYDVVLGEDTVLKIEDLEDKLDMLFNLDSILRSNSVFIRPYISSPEGSRKVYMLEKPCLDKLSQNIDSEKVNRIFHVDDYLESYP